MANVLIEENTMTEIADAIREQTGSTDGILPANMAYGIRSIQSGASSWNDLTDRPFYDEVYEDSCSFETTPTTIFDFAGQMTFYKVSDLQLTYDQLLKTVFSVVSGETTTEVTPTAENFLFNNESISGFTAADGDIAIGVAYATGDITTDYGVVSPPETGTYLGWPVGDTPPTTLSISIYCEDLKQLDEKYLPEIDALPEVTTDDNGKVLGVVDGAWAATEASSGDGTSSGELSVQKVSLTTCDSSAIATGAGQCIVSLTNNSMITVSLLFTTQAAFTVSEVGSTHFTLSATVSEAVGTAFNNAMSAKYGLVDQLMGIAAYGGTDKNTLFWFKLTTSAKKLEVLVFPMKSLVNGENGRGILTI